MKLDILVISAHPDDAELSCGGTIISHVNQGYKVGIVDLTKGELGTRGTGQIRIEEAEDAAKILGVSLRENLEFEDGNILNDKHHQLKLIKIIRKYRPDIIITNAPEDRHPDHADAAEVVCDSAFYSGLFKIKTIEEEKEQEPWRPKVIYHYIQFINLKPDFVVDISPYTAQKLEAIKAFKSQFHNPDSDEPETFLTQSNFFSRIQSRDIAAGTEAGFDAAEGFIVKRMPGVKDIKCLS